MRPVLFAFGFDGQTISVLSYEFFMTAAVVFALTAAVIAIKYYKLPLKKFLPVLVIMIVSVFIGARLLYTILYLPKSIQPAEKIFTLNYSNFSLHGGLGAGLLAAWMSLRKDKASFLVLMDILSPIAGSAAAISRVGCYLNGCCFGKVTAMPWGIRFPLFSSVHVIQYNTGMISPISGPLPVHPAQFYEIIGALISSVFALLILKKRMSPGYAAAFFGLVYSACRFIVFFFREFPYATQLSNFIRGPLTYGAAIIIFLIIIYRLYLQDRNYL